MHRLIAPAFLFAAALTIVALPPASASAETPSAAKPATASKQPAATTSLPGLVTIGDVKRKAPANNAAYATGALEYEVELVNTGRVALPASLVLRHAQNPPVTVTTDAAPGRSTIVIADPAGLTHCFKTLFLLKLDALPSVNVEVASKCTFQSRVISPPSDQSEALGKLSYRSTRMTNELKCDLPLQFESFVANNSNSQVTAELGIKPPSGQMSPTFITNVALNPHEQKKVDKFSSSPFHGDVGRYAVYLRDAAKQVPTYDPGWAVDVTRSCQPEVTRTWR